MEIETQEGGGEQVQLELAARPAPGRTAGLPELARPTDGPSVGPVVLVAALFVGALGAAIGTTAASQPQPGRAHAETRLAPRAIPMSRVLGPYPSPPAALARGRSWRT